MNMINPVTIQPSASSSVVLVDDEQDILDMQQEALTELGLTSEAFVSPTAGWERIQRGDISLVITDWNMPEMTGIDLLFRTRSLPNPPYVILVTAFGTIPRAVQAMNSGAFNFLEKPFKIASFLELVKDAVNRHRRKAISTSDATQMMSSNATNDDGSDPIVQSPVMRDVMKRACSAAAAAETTVLLLGESGTGKEVMADYIHRNSPRKKAPIVRVNCGALPQHLIESELFGHERGAFTGADKRRVGRFEEAHGGTLFLDEIGDLPLPLQVKLLRALQERTIERLGSSTPIPVDFRLICATHRDLKAAIAENTFREDLFYRINVLPISIPPLRDRAEDILPLAHHFFKSLRANLSNGPEGIDDNALAALKDYSWPGNVRQLRNAIECALVLCKGQTINPADLPEEVRNNSPMSKRPPSSGKIGMLESMTAGIDTAAPILPTMSGLKNSSQSAETDAIRSALERHHWRMKPVANELKISRSTLYQRMQLYGIKRD